MNTTTIRSGMMLLFMLLLFIETSAQNSCTSVQAGNWNTSSTWGCGSIPKDGFPRWSREYIIIDSDVFIYRDQTIDLRESAVLEVIINSGRTLTFQPNAKLLLPQNAKITIQQGGTIHAEDRNSDNLILMGNTGLLGSDIFSSGTGVWGDACGCYSGDVTGPLTIDRNTNSSTLPVELVFFKAHCHHKQVELEWQTATETDNDYFVIERSVDALVYEDIARISGAGNSTGTINYHYTDVVHLQGNKYYRLRQVDYDGTTVHSPIVSVSISEQHTAQIFPKIMKAHEQAELSIQGKFQQVKIQYMQAAGNIVKTVQLQATQEILLDHSDLQPGIYFVKIQTDCRYYLDKIIIQ